MFKFVGIGSAFNVHLGNNSAYILEGNHLILIDCGSNIFDRLVKSGILNGVKKLTIIITHKHPDHIGSLGDLLFYATYVLNIKTDLYGPSALKIDNTLNEMGVYDYNYNLHDVKEDEFITIEDFNLSFKAVPVNHYPGMNCFGYIFVRDNQKAFYSADTFEMELSVYEHIDTFDFIYQDVSSIDFEGNPHLSYPILKNNVPSQHRSIIHCMHLDTQFNREQAIQDGFNVVEIDKHFI